MNRYVRQDILPEIGASGQSRFAEASVLVIGAGGLAATVLPALAGAGVGHITVVDGDTVELANLHRQTLFAEADAGRLKAEVAVERLNGLNSEISVSSRPHWLTPTNAEELAQSSGIVVDCADSYAVSYTLSDSCLRMEVPLITASVLGRSGYVGGFCGTAPSLRAVFPDPPENAADCATAGVMWPVVALLGAAQAQMTLAVLLGLSPSPLGQVLQFDMRDYRSSGFRFDKASEPASHLPFISIAEIVPSDIVVDLRVETEAPLLIHAQAQRILPENLAAALKPEDRRLVLACASGLRAWRAAEQLKDTWSGEMALVAAKAT